LLVLNPIQNTLVIKPRTFWDEIIKLWIVKLLNDRLISAIANL
jgi:hypothetical protein